jgi:hypothetical protein
MRPPAIGRVASVLSFGYVINNQSNFAQRTQVDSLELYPET